MSMLLKSKKLKEFNLEGLGKVKRVLLSNDIKALYLVTEDSEDVFGRDRLVGFIYEEDECAETSLLVEPEIEETEEDLTKRGDWSIFGFEFGELMDIDVSTLGVNLIFDKYEMNVELKQIKENDDYSLDNLNLHWNGKAR